MTPHDFLAALFPRLDAHALIEVKSLQNKKPRQRWFHRVEDVIREGEFLAETHDVYFSVAARNGPLGTAEATAYVNAFFADDDGTANLEGLPAPSIIVASGQPRHQHVYWLLRTPWVVRSPSDLAGFEALNKGIAAHIGADNCSDIAHIYRLPGTLNHKPGGPYRVELVEFHPEWRYDAQAFEQYRGARRVPSQNGANGTHHQVSPTYAWADRVPRDARNMTQYQEARDLAQMGIPHAETISIMRRRFAEHYEHGPPGDERDMLATIRSAYNNLQRRQEYIREAAGINAGPRDDEPEPGNTPAPEPQVVDKPPRQFPRTDAGNGELFAYLYEGRVKYDHARSRWLQWAGHWWREDRLEGVVQLVKAAARHRHMHALDLASDDEKKRESAFAIASENHRKVDDALAMARTEPEIRDSGEGWDGVTRLLGTLNGALDLRTGLLRAGKPEDRISKHVPVEFNPYATCPKFDAFLERVQPKPHMRAYLQRRVGYALTGDVGEQDLLFLYGGGANGKTTFATVIKGVLGRDYAKQAAPKLLIKSLGERHPTELADLEGARLVVSTEVDEGLTLAEELVKQLTGGDDVKARRMRQDFWEFRPAAKIMLLANHKPQIKGTDYAIWRRIKLVPFDVTIPEAEWIADFGDKLVQEEAAGILNWMLAGCLDWQQNGMQTPPEVEAATAQYKRESDPLTDFLEPCCTFGPDDTVLSGQLYTAYRTWSERAGYPLRDILSNKAFSQRLVERNFDKRDRSAGAMFFGIGLRKGDPPS